MWHLRIHWQNDLLGHCALCGLYFSVKSQVCLITHHSPKCLSCNTNTTSMVVSYMPVKPKSHRIPSKFSGGLNGLCENQLKSAPDSMWFTCMAPQEAGVTESFYTFLLFFLKKRSDCIEKNILQIHATNYHSDKILTLKVC